MIFFILVIVPSSNVLKELKLAQKILFKDYKLPPTPFPFLITEILKSKPTRHSRKKIADLFPEKIHLEGIKINKHCLTVNTKEKISFINSSNDQSLSEDISNGFILSQFNRVHDKDKKYITKQLDFIKYLSFTNYSLAAFQINSLDKIPFWSNMIWEKVWEVKKGK